MSKIFCILAGSGGGKDTIKKALPLPHIVSYRTRQLREGEVDGVDGYFVTEADYQQAKKEGVIVAETLYQGHHYWTTRYLFDDYLNRGIPLLYVVDRQGVEVLKQHYGEEKVVAIWIDCSLESLAERMTNRGDTDEQVLSRIKYHTEISEGEKEICDYVVDGNQSVESVKNSISFIILESLFHKNI